MTTTATHSFSQAVANGLSPIPFSFQALSAAEVGVLRNGVEETGFTVLLNGDDTGTITPNISWGADSVLIYSKPYFSQPANFPRFNPLFPDQVERALDRQARTSLALKRHVDQMVTLISGLDADDLAALRADIGLRNDVAAAGGAGLVGFSAGSSYPANTVGDALRGNDGDTLKHTLRYVRTAPYALRLGWNPVDQQAAAVAIGANDAGRGRGSLQIGGAGPRDSGNGSYVMNDGHPNWNIVQSSKLFNPTEWNIYGNGTGGIATRSGANTLTKTEGVDWTAAMIGRTLWFKGAPYTVQSVPNATTCVLTSDPPAGTGAWNMIVTSGSGTCSVSGTTITRISGDPFVPAWGGTGFVFKVNGVAVTVTQVDSDTYTASAAPGDTASAPYEYSLDINAQIATTRLQKVAGTSEENLSIFARPDGYWVVPAAAGSGELYPLWLCSNYERVVELHATGKYVSLGGVAGREALRCLHDAANPANRVEMQGGVAGLPPTIRGRGSDANVGLALDTKGTGFIDFTSGSFGRRNFRIFGSAGVDNLAVDAGTGLGASAPYIGVEGQSTNIDLRLVAKGTGRVQIGNWTSNADAAVNGYIEVKDLAGNVRKLATIA